MLNISTKFSLLFHLFLFLIGFLINEIYLKMATRLFFYFYKEQNQNIKKLSKKKKKKRIQTTIKEYLTKTEIFIANILFYLGILYSIYSFILLYYNFFFKRPLDLKLLNQFFSQYKNFPMRLMVLS
jgi:hypothetical protein